MSIILDPARIPLCFGYARVSDPKQNDGLSIDIQRDRIIAFYKFMLEPKGVRFADVFVDPGESAFKIPFPQRKAGGALLARLMPGDHIVFYKFDRAFRSVLDFINTTTEWRKKGIFAHYIDMGGSTLSTDTAAGEMLLTQYASISQFYSRQLSERVKDAYARKRATLGHSGSRNPPRGWKYQTRGGVKHLIPDDHDRAVWTLARLLHERDGLGVEKIAVMFGSRGVRTTQARAPIWDARDVQRGIEACRKGNWNSPPLALPPEKKSTYVPKKIFPILPASSKEAAPILKRYKAAQKPPVPVLPPVQPLSMLPENSSSGAPLDTEQQSKSPATPSPDTPTKNDA